MSDTELAGVKLAAGTYKLEWRGDGPDVEVTFKQGKEVLVTARATLVPRNPVVRNTALLVPSGDGATALSEVRFAGKAFSLRFAKPAAAPKPMTGEEKPPESEETRTSSK